MELIYTDAALADQGVIPWASGDFSEGSENSWSVKAARVEGLAKGCLVYVDGTEFGGIVDATETETETGAVTYSGRTWRGMLDEAVLCPPSGSDYASASGDANAAIGSALALSGSPLPFAATTAASPLTVPSSYRFPRYCTLLEGLVSMLKAAGGVLSVSYSRGSCTLSAASAPETVAWSDGADITLKSSTSVNHLVCLGGGELKDRTVVHLYADSRGRVSRTQTITGTGERTQVYDYANAKDEDDLVSNGAKRLEGLQSTDSAALDEGVTGLYSIGQVLTCRDAETGEAVSETVTEKIGRIDGSVLTVEYKTGAAPEEPEGAE